jgi:hypothetical protein
MAQRKAALRISSSHRPTRIIAPDPRSGNLKILPMTQRLDYRPVLPLALLEIIPDVAVLPAAAEAEAAAAVPVAAEVVATAVVVDELVTAAVTAASVEGV